MNDLYSLLPHSRKDAKLDTKTKLYQLNELAELYNCNNVFFFEARKGKDLYAWMSKAPNGPTVKMHLQNCEWARMWPKSLEIDDSIPSTYNGGTPFHRQLPQRLPAHPLLRRRLRHTATPPRHQRTFPPHIWRTQRLAQGQAIHRSCPGIHHCGRKDLDTVLPN